jgi:formylglycine-generating enzyme required for sulfatase activity
MELVLVPAGEFVMGCSPDDKRCYGKPHHPVEQVS